MVRVFIARGAYTAACTLVFMEIWISSGRAQDWPQILGPERSGRLEDNLKIATNWPVVMPVAWQAGLGTGFSGPAVVDGKVYILNRLGNQEQLEAFSDDQGQNLWRSGWPATYKGSFNPDNGPRCVPTIVDGKAVCYGAAGDLACIDAQDGKLLWRRSLRQEYDADDGYFGAGSSPLVVDNLIILCLGSQKAGIIGVDLVSGETRWTSTNYEASYASPIAVDRHTALVVTRLRTVLLDLSDGKVLSEVAFGSRGPTVNAATPISVGNARYLLTASYGVGTTLLDTQGRQLKEIFSRKPLLASQYNTPVFVKDRVIGIDGREDVGVASLKAIDLEKQQLLWEEANFGTAHLIGLGNQIISLSLDGTLGLLDGQAKTFQLLAQTRLPPGTYRAPPAFSQGRLFVRNSDASSGRSQLICVQLPFE